MGIYRVDGPNSFTVIADIGAFALANPPSTPFDVPTGLQFALDTYRGGFLVTDGHHNRVLQVTLDGTITELIGFGNIVPTGLALSGNTVYMAEAGPVPHLPEDGKVVSFRTKVPGRGGTGVRRQPPRRRGVWSWSSPVCTVTGRIRGRTCGSPALPDTGALLSVNHDGTLTVLADRLNLPTSMEFIKDTAYVVTLTGEIWKIDGV